MKIKFSSKFLFVFLLLLPLLCFPQKGFFLDAGPGYAYLANQDDAMSPLLYSGSSVFAVVGLNKISPDLKHHLLGTFSYGRMQPTTGYMATSIRYSVNYTPLWKIYGDSSTLPLVYAGGGLNTFQTMKFNSHYTNNSFYSDFVTSIGPAGMITYPFQLLKHKTTAELSLQLPVFSWIVRPGYATTGLPGSLESEDSYFKDFITSGKLKTINKYQQLISKVGLTWYLKNGNAIKFGYIFDFYHFNDLNELSFMNHALWLATSFNFSKTSKP